MKVAVLLQKVHHLDPVILQPEHALHMATRGGARAAGLGDRIGAIEAGRLADLVVVDLNSVFVAPVHRVVSADCIKHHLRIVRGARNRSYLIQ